MRRRMFQVWHIDHHSVLFSVLCSRTLMYKVVKLLSASGITAPATAPEPSAGHFGPSGLRGGEKQRDWLMGGIRGPTGLRLVPGIPAYVIR